MFAGANWYKYGRRYVKIYELTSVKVKGTPGSWALDLRDAEGRKVWTELDPIPQNPRLRPPEMCRAVESKQSMIVKVGARW
jgi:hypothetical protein